MLDAILLLPIIFPVSAAIILALLMPRVDVARQAVLWRGVLLIEIALVLVNVAPGSHRWVVTVWERTGYTLALQLDGVTQLVVLTMLVLFLARELVAPARVDPLVLLVLGAAILFAAADGLLMLLVAWTLLDLALFVWRWARQIERESASHSLALGLLTGMMLYAGALIARADGGVLFALALWARLGLFPFHTLLPARGADEYDVWVSRGIPLLAAANVWLHWDAFRITAPYTLIGILGGASWIVTALWMWRTADATRALGFAAMHALTFVPLSIALGGEAGVALALWQTLAVAFALCLGEIALRWRAETRMISPRWVGGLALGALAGLPLTPAFLGRMGSYVVLVERGEWLLLTLVFITTLSVFAPLWYRLGTLTGSPTRVPTRGERTGVILALGAFGVLALAMPFLTPALGIAEASARALERVIWTDNAFGVWLSVSVLLIPFIGALFVRASALASPRANALVARLARAGDLEWFTRAVARGGWRLGVLVRDAFSLTEENLTVWILFAALWSAIFIAISR
jgi:hypothetical protein